MKLSALRLHNVRRFAGRGIAVENIGDGVNVLCAVNEFGKSTCFDALHALFFQPHTGTPGAVQGLRPYSGGNPLVEADIATSNGSFRLTKQFYGGRRAMVRELGSGRLVAQADEAERFIAALVQGGTAGPAGLLWVRQGITGIERRAKSDEEGEKRARESVLTSVQGEVESLTGGRRMAQAVASCEEELSRLVTQTGRPKAGGPYAQALEDCERLAGLEKRLSGEVADLRAALDRRRAIRTALAELEDPDQDAARRAALKQAEVACIAARAHGDALAAAQAQAALARNRHAATKQALDSYRRNRQRLAELRIDAEHAMRLRDDALARQRETTQRGNAAFATVETAESEEREARALLARLDKALKARDATERLAVVQATYADAESARIDIENAEAKIAALGIAPAAVKQLEVLESEILSLRAMAAARSPTIGIAYDPGISDAISIDGTVLTEAEERPIGDRAVIAIAGIGRITLTMQRAGGGKDDLAQAQARRSALLTSLGVSDLAEARLRQTQLQDLSAGLGLARQRLGLLAPQGLPALRETIALLQAQAGDAIELKAEPDAVRSTLATAEERVASARNAAREAQPLRQAADAAVVAAERTLATVTVEMAGLSALLGPEAEHDRRGLALADDDEQAKQALASDLARVESLQAGGVDLASAEAKLRRMASVVDSAAAEIAKLREESADLNGHIRARSDAAVEEAWQEAAEELAAAQLRLKALEGEAALLMRLRNALETARASARDHYFQPVMGELRPLLGLLFENATVTFDEDTLLPRTVRRNGLEEPVGVLSGGMREQLAVLTRLAFARLLAKDGQPAPVILDDALVYSDDDRIERMFDALHRHASDQQIIVFSCRQRAFAQLGGNILQMRPWTPES